MIVTFTGDISITGSFTDKVNTNSEIFSSEIRAELKSSDFVVGNLEGPTTAITKSYNQNTPLKSPINTIEYLKSRNFNVFNLANNHILDFGEQGLKDTLQHIYNEHCFCFGAELSKEKAIAPTIIQKGEISIAIFGFAKTSPSKIGNAFVFSSDELSTLKLQIKNYKNQVDFIIVNFHGGEEYSLYPSPIKRKFLKKIAELEAVNCVIAHHSHTFQGYEKHKNTYIFYSLGNFIFDISNHKPYKETNNSALLKMHFTKTNFTFSFTPYIINDGLVLATNSSDFKTRLKELSDFTNYQKKWQKEAFRILFRKENPLHKEENEHENSLQNKSFLSTLASKEFYSKAVKIVKDKYAFSLYANAIIYKLKKKYNL